MLQIAEIIVVFKREIFLIRHLNHLNLIKKDYSKAGILKVFDLKVLLQ
jgi:hypothetical protein